MRSTRDKVETILRDYPDTRNSDKLLLKKFWEIFDARLFITNEAGAWLHVDQISNLTSAESIRRHRQMIQLDGKYMATDGVINNRRVKARKVASTVYYGQADFL